MKLGGLVGRVGASVAGSRLVSLALPGASKGAKRAENLVRNAERIVETLGQLKGAAMKAGQMLSLQDTLLPPEVAAVLRSLQKQAPRIPFEVVLGELRAEIPDFERVFAHIEPEAFAAASIGQVHRATLADGREVAVKIQYPGIDRVVEADLGNLRRVLKTLLGLVSSVDFDPVWRELRARLREELDYLHEAESLRRMAALHADVPDVVIPRVVDEATTRSVLTMDYVPGLSPDEACSDRYRQELKDQWGLVLFDLLLRGLFTHRFLHADPNLANFAFLPDGRVVVYDLGCTKEVPARLARGYAELCFAVLEERVDDVPRVLARMGVRRGDGEPLSDELVAPYVESVLKVVHDARPYRFGEDGRVHRRIFDAVSSNLGDTAGIRFPRDIVFVNRTVVGLFGNLSRLKATGPWREHVERFAATAVGGRGRGGGGAFAPPARR